MKIVVISDTHIHDQEASLPASLVEELRNADMVIHAGDFVSMGIFEKLKSLCTDFRAVCGNMDPQGICEALPRKIILKAGKFKIGIMHGYGAPNNLIEVLSGEFRAEKPDIVIFGHSHSACNEKIGGILFFNPGSLMDKVFAKTNTYGIIEINDKIEAKIIAL